LRSILARAGQAAAHRRAVATSLPQGAGPTRRYEIPVTSIGLLNEKPLHASLKEWYAEPGDRLEVPVDGYVIDIVRGDLLMEIQTGTIAAIKPKLTALVRSHPTRLIYPIAKEKWIVKPAGGGKRKDSRRKSPKRGRVEDLFWEMVGLPHLLPHPNFSFEVLMIREEEIRRYDGNRSRYRRGWAREERHLLEVVDRLLFQGPDDWRAMLPEGLEVFTARELADVLAISIELAQKMTYLLRGGKVIDQIGRRGRANLYTVPGA
jgi:hypothetical protein